MRIVGILLSLVLAVSLVLPVAALADCPEKGLAKCQWDAVKWETNPDSWGLYLQHWGRTPIQAMSRLRGMCGPKTLCAQLGTYCPKKDQANPENPKNPYQEPNACPGGCAACTGPLTGTTAPPVVDPQSLATCGSCSCPTCSTNPCTAPTCPPSPGQPCPTCPATGQNSSPTCPTDSLVVAPETLSQPVCGFCWGISLAFAGKSWAAADIGPDPRINNDHPNHFGTAATMTQPDGTIVCASDGGHGGDWGITGSPHNQCCALTWALQDNCLSRPYKDTCSLNSKPAPNPEPPL